MQSVVTGVAGFIGSHIAGRLLALGHHVLGIDSLEPYYDPELKRANVLPLRASSHFRFVEADLTTADLGPLLHGSDYVFHQAGQPGVRASWNASFARYAACNVLATQRLLAAARLVPLRKFVYASSSSVYGNAPLPMRESSLPCPLSPYAVTKLAGEHLCLLYGREHAIPVVALRYFTVYGPRQRPDMAFHRFIQALLQGTPLVLYGDGAQRRDFTYIDDVVDANLLAACSCISGETFNIGGGASISLAAVLALLERVTGHAAQVARQQVQAGDTPSTAADCTHARLLLGYVPRVSLEEGVRRQVAWHRRAQAGYGTV